MLQRLSEPAVLPFGLVLAFLVHAVAALANAQGTAFTYQGRLLDVCSFITQSKISVAVQLDCKPHINSECPQ